ncbi:oxidoreductase [Paenibacillus tyrfis]|uniref:SDR family NAD(P)-dependent oxidoreductase n=1 Tax=Paenibacillus TaxID=44249 RepID=UPI001C1FE09E|nr:MULTISPECIES: SDR family NAD(P)-dependent oxidoreductase [Paenibacillus]MBU7319987.1 SDR family NAD(P)-dependent oxidoreductase [Paenibacillus oleatilyticus]GLI04738.1 oxidoreductase [Paenibacillus tyrfis]
MDKQGKYTVITGASSGIGYATAKAFAKRKKNIILVARRENNLNELKREILRDIPELDIVVKAVDISVSQNAHQLYRELNQYQIETWINNAGFGSYDRVSGQDLEKIETMLRLNVEALTIFSSLYVRDYRDVDDTQLINISSAGGYTLVPTAVTYCASKFFVSAFTEGLAHELKAANAKLQAKVLAPAATKTEFGKVANNTSEYDYDKIFNSYHTSDVMANFLLQLYDSNMTVGIVDRETFEFRLSEPLFAYAGDSKNNQKVRLND